MRFLARAERLFHTVRYLRPVQIVGRALVMLRRINPDLSPAPAVRHPRGRWRLPQWREASMLSASRFRFLNEEREIQSRDDWNTPAWPKLWLYNLHYFDDLDAIGSEQRRVWHRDLIARWISENPPAEGNGWEPYCLSLRIVNWCRYAWSDGVLAADAVHSLAVQLRALEAQLELHLLGNHLFENAKALVFGGLFFEGPEADRWLQVGLRYLRRELKEQVLADGGHFERSPMYHHIMVSGVLELLAADQVTPSVLPSDVVEDLRAAAAVMLDWAQVMSHEDGGLAFFNDSAFGVAPTLQDLQAQAREVTVAGAPPARVPIRRLTASGYVRAESGPAMLLADVGEVGPDYLPGHAHADTLSCELSLRGVRLVVNSGTSTYATIPERALERGTAAHNTVVVDGQDSSEVWSSFRVARRARPIGFGAESNGDRVTFWAAHNGYRRLPGHVTHRRRWTLSSERLVVRDDFEGRPVSCVAYWHLHPDASLERVAPNRFVCSMPGAGACEIILRGCEATLGEGRWSPEFGLQRPNLHLCATSSGLPIETEFLW